MKKYYIYGALMLALAALASCSKDDDVSAEQVAFNKLAGTWSAAGGAVKVDGADVTADYTGFRIAFASLSNGAYVYTVENGGHAFDGISMDTWDFANSSFTRFTRGADDVAIDYTVEGEFLTLTFTLPDPLDDGGRVKGLFGQFEMRLKRV